MNQSEVEEVKQEEEASTEKPLPEPEVADVEKSSNDIEEVEKSSTEKVEELTSEKPTNVEWSSDDPAPQEVATGGFKRRRNFCPKWLLF